MENHGGIINGLSSGGRVEIGRSPCDAGALLARLDEMNHRWHALKQRSMAIRSRLESNTQHWHALLLSLREIIEWLIRKDMELSGFAPLAGDVASVQRQIVSHFNIYKLNEFEVK